MQTTQQGRESGEELKWGDMGCTKEGVKWDWSFRETNGGTGGTVLSRTGG